MTDDTSELPVAEEVQDAATTEDLEASTDLRYLISSYGADYRLTV